MKKWLLYVCICLPVLLFSQKESLQKEIKKIFLYDTEIDFEKTPVSIIGVIDRDSTFFLNLEDNNNPSNGNKNSIFEIGSITKVFTATLAAILAEEDILDWTEPINSFLPSEYQNPKLEELTIWDLVNHHGSFPRIPEQFGRHQEKIQDPYNHYTAENLLQYYRDYIPKNPNNKFQYSHTGYALLELVLEFAANNSFEDLLNRHIFSPLKMKNSFIEFPKNKTIFPGLSISHRKPEPWHFSSFAGSEGMKSSANDLSIFLKSLMGDHNSFSEIAEKYLQVEAPTNYNKQIFIANGWHLIKQNKRYNIFTHTGKTSGHNAFIAFIPETKTGVIILSNSVIGTKDLGFLILRMINDNWNREHE